MFYALEDRMERWLLNAAHMHAVMVTAIAEKIVTAMHRGAVNTRWCDYADVLLLARDHPVDGADLQAALTAVAAHDGVTLTPLSNLLDDYPTIAQNRWVQWRANQEQPATPSRRNSGTCSAPSLDS